MADIFLSYNEKDRDTVRALAETLKSIGWSVWWDRRIPAGGTWRSLLEHELEAMRCMVVVWSAHSIKSDWVFEEATEGRTKGCLVPVCIEAVRPPPGFREIQAADLVGWDRTATFLGMRALIEDIEQRIGKPAVAAAGETALVASGVAAVGDGRSAHEPHEPHEAIDLSQVRQHTAPPTAISAAPSRRPVAALAAVAATAALAFAIYLGIDRSERSDDAHKSAGIQTLDTGPSSGTSERPGPADPPITNEALNTPGNDVSDAGTTTLPATPKATANTTHKRSDDQASTAQCADLMQRVSLGETLSPDAGVAWQKCARKK